MKKVLSIIGLMIVTLISSVFLVSCGDKYKNLKLEVQYLEWTREVDGSVIKATGDWKTIDLEHGLDFVLSDDYKVESGAESYYRLLIRVRAKGTKKSVGAISISSTSSPALQLSSNQTYEDDEFEIRVFNTGSVTLFVVPSVKSDSAQVSFPINLYDEIHSINQNDEYFPALACGSDLKLNELGDMINYLGVNNGETNQRGVTYQLYNDSNQLLTGTNGVAEYRQTNQDNSYVRLRTLNNENVLEVGSQFTGNQVKLRATSVYSMKTSEEKEIACDIVIKVVKNLAQSSINVNYLSQFDPANSSVNSTSQNKVSEMSLYPQLSDYRSSKIVISGLFEGEGLFNFLSSDKSNGIKYDVQIYVDGKNVTDGSTLDAYNGIYVSEIKTDENSQVQEQINSGKIKIYSIESSEWTKSNTNNIDIFIGFTGLRFTSKDYRLYSTKVQNEGTTLSYSFKVNREDIPQAVKINDNTYQDHGTFTSNLYTNYTNTAKGLGLNIEAVRTIEKETDITMKFYTNTDSETYESQYRPIEVHKFNDSILNPTDDGYKLLNFSNSLYVKFSDSTNEQYPSIVYVKLSVLASPLTFEGKSVDTREYLEVTGTLNVVGSLNSVGLTSGEGSVDLFRNDNTDALVEGGKGIESKLTLAASSGNVATSDINIFSKNGNILFSADNVEFSPRINCSTIINNTLYIKGTSNRLDNIIVQAINGVQFSSRQIHFVDSVGVDSEGKVYPVGLTTNSNNVINAYEFAGNGESDKNYYTSGEGEAAKSYEGYYLALQLGRNADFLFGYGNNFSSHKGIYALSVKNLTNNEFTSLGKSVYAYGQDAVKTQIFSNKYSFNLSAVSKDCVTVLLLTLDYYAGVNFDVKSERIQMYLEVAVYSPVTTLTTTASRNEISYVNEILTEQAKTRINIETNANASTQIHFSNSDLNDKINKSENNNNGYMFNIQVSNDEENDSERYLSVSGKINGKNYIDLTTSYYEMTLLKQPSFEKEINVTFKVEEFGYTRTFTKTIRVVDIIRAKEINITGTYQYNVYMSLMSEEEKTAGFLARISNTDATFKELRYELYNFDSTKSDYLGEKVNGDTILGVNINNELTDNTNNVSLTAKSNENGGKFVLRIFSPDYKTKEEIVKRDIVVTISDGTENNPYYLRNVSDFKNIKNGMDKHYVIAQDIDVSTITEPIKSDSTSTFSGSIDGLLSVVNLEDGVVYHTQNKLKNLNIKNSDEENANSAEFYLFAENSGTLKNIVLDNVTIDIKLNTGISNNSLNVGALVGKNSGKIINCSVDLLKGKIELDSTSSAYQDYNIGALVGLNEGEIYYYDQDNDDLKQYASAIQMAKFNAPLDIVVKNMETSHSPKLNVGGVIGQNKKKVLANNFGTSAIINEILTAIVQVKVSINNQIKDQLTTNVGGFVGLVDGEGAEISQICLTGKVEVYGDNIFAGGLVGSILNGAKLKDSSAYSTSVIGGGYEIEAETKPGVKNQFIAGAVGSVNNGNIENVSVVILDIDSFAFASNKTEISGVYAVAGLVGSADNLTMKYSIVQSFVDDFKLALKVDNSNESLTLSGILARGNNTFDISSCYVKANLEVTGYSNEKNVTVSTLFNNTGSSKVQNSYFIGKIKILTSSNEILDFTNGTGANIVKTSNYYSSESDFAYSLVYGYRTNDSKLEYGILTCGLTKKLYYVTDKDGKEHIFTTLPAVENGNWKLDNVSEETGWKISGSSDIWWTSVDDTEGKNFEKYNKNLPLLKKDNKPMLLAIVESLVANITDTEFKDPDAEEKTEEPIVYMNENGIFMRNNENISAIVFVSDRTYDLVESDEAPNGLIKLEVIPEIALLNYTINVVSGQDLISLVGNRITFNKSGKVELQFLSLTNRSAVASVTLFVEEGVDGFDVKDNNETIENLISYVGEDTILHLVPTFKDRESKINTTHLKLTAKVLKPLESIDDYEDGKTYKLENGEYVLVSHAPITDVENYYVLVESEDLTLDGLGASTGDYLNFSDLQLGLMKSNDYETKYILVLESYLDLTKYSLKTNQTLYDYLTNLEIKLKTKTINWTIYPVASKLNVYAPSVNVASGAEAEINFELITKYLNLDVTEQSVVFNKDIYDNYLLTNIKNSDTFRARIESDVDTLGLNSIWDLFNYSCKFKLNNDKAGYEFNFTLTLKDEYKNIYQNKKFKITFLAESNYQATDSVDVIFEPQELRTLRIENMKGGVVSPLSGLDPSTSSHSVIYKSDETSSNIIVPGRSGLIKIFAEPSYACIDRLEIRSSTVMINNRPYTINFQQMLFDRANNYFISYPGFTTEESTLRLQKNSEIDENGNLVYTGVIYVRTILENLVGVEKTFEVIVSAVKFERDEDGNYDEANPQIASSIETSKLLLTQYNPGVSIDLENAIQADLKGEKVYLVEKTSTNMKLRSQVYGYHLNQNPNIRIKWKDNDNKDNITSYLSYSLNSVVASGIGDSSYILTYDFNFTNLNAPIEISISLSLIDGGEVMTSEEKTIIVYPVDYIPAEVYMRNTANSVMRVGLDSTSPLDLVWMSDNQDLNSEEINDLINERTEENPDGKTLASYLYTTRVNQFGNTEYEEITIGDHGAFRLNYEDGRVSISAQEQSSVNIEFRIKYNYIYNEETDRFEIAFYKFTDDVQANLLVYRFNVQFVVLTSEEAPDFVSSAEEFLAMVDGGNYILMNDIELDNYAPLTTQIASLDGNGHRIFIKNFVVTTGEEIIGGLFTEIAENAIIKNLIIDLSKYSGTSGDKVINLSDENAQATDTYFGFIAGRNNGIIYNSEIINTSSNITIKIKTSSQNVHIGGLVAENNGNITNSRFGTTHFEKIDVLKNGSVTITELTTKKITLQVSGIVGGIVAENNGIISSTYFTNADIVNDGARADDDRNMTAGFVAVNSGSVLNSYVKSTGINSENIRGKDNEISATGAGSAAGFVFENNGIIENCYTNIRVKSLSSAVAGFVYRNNIGGTISKAYSASLVSSQNTNSTLATELPFVGVGIDGQEVNKLLSYGELNNCYYLEEPTDNFDKNFELGADMDIPIALNVTNFQDSKNLLNFAFVDGNYEQSLQGVWTYYVVDSNDSGVGRTVLPDLTSANELSRSIRYAKYSEDENEHTLIYAQDYNLGSKNNPFIIRNADEYNSVFNISSVRAENVFVGYVKLIGPVSFETGDEANTTQTINTTLGYTLGDEKERNLTVFDGNGMTISGVDVHNNTLDNVESLGLFNQIYYSIVKNVKIRYNNMPYTSTNAKYSGGLSGKVVDSYIIEMEITGADTTITGKNIVGGVAGIVSGNSGIFNVSANLSVNATHKEFDQIKEYVSFSNFISLGYNRDTTLSGTTNEEKYQSYLSNLSYAGGLAGVVDYETDGTFSTKVNLNKITIGGGNSTHVTGDIAGFVAGYLGRGVNANRLFSQISIGSYVNGAFIVGGLVGQNYARIAYSQVTSNIDEQFEYDKQLADYVLSLKSSHTVDMTINREGDNYGNLSFIQSDFDMDETTSYAGGLIGANYGGSILHSYTKASLDANSKYIGGVTGLNINGTYNQVYAANVIELAPDDTNTKFVGGFIGRNADRHAISGVYRDLNYNAATDDVSSADSVVISTIYDEGQIKANSDRYIDYMVGEATGTTKLYSSQGEGINPLYVYALSYENISSVDSQIKSSDAIHFERKEIDDLFDLTDEKQKETFENLFINFDMNIWEKDREKFYPLLRDNSAINHFEINDESDLFLMELYPDGDFVLNGNLNLTRVYNNYVVQADFTGTFIGRLGDDDTPPTISGIKILLDSTTETAGFFRSTEGALINGISFKYDYMKTEERTLSKSNVGLLSPEDKDSNIANVAMIATTRDDGTEALNFNNVNITNFGGIFGTSQSTNIVATHVTMRTTLNTTNTELQQSTIGGLVGTGSGKSGDNVDLVILNSSFTGTLKSNSNMIGGLIGRMNFGDIANSKVIDSSIEFGADSMFVGGGIGYQNNSYISGSDIKIAIKSMSTTANASAQYIGGMSGYLANDDLRRDDDIEDNTINTDYSIITNTETLILGGVAGYVANNAKISRTIAWIHGEVGGKTEPESSEIITPSAVIFGGIVGLVKTDGFVNLESNFFFAENEDDYEGFNITTDNIVAAGFVGKIDSSKLTLSILNSASAGAIWANSRSTDEEEASETIKLVLSGVIGEWTNETEIDLDASTQIGEEENVSSRIDNCWTTLVLDYSNFRVYQQNEEKTFKFEPYLVSAIIGNIGKFKGKLDMTDVYYSSDFNLALEEHDIFNNKPVDLMAETLIGIDSRIVVFTSDRGWTYVTDNAGLPYLEGLENNLRSMGLLAIFDGNESTGSHLSPIVLNSAESEDKLEINENAKYTYYLLVGGINDATLNIQLEDDFKGFILGSGIKVLVDQNIKFSLAPHSAISNLEIDAENRLKSDQMQQLVVETEYLGGLVDNNAGTIFNIRMDYSVILDNDESVNIYGGAIAGRNSGNILYAYNSGVLENIGNLYFAGITYINDHGYIANSSFVGTSTSINSSYNVAGITCSNNYGVIYNSFAAGVISTTGDNEKFYSTFISPDKALGETDEILGLIVNCYYDKYANSEFDSITTDGNSLKAVTTHDLQTNKDNGTNNAGLVGNYVLYPLLVTSGEEVKAQVQNSEYYNYGYPVYKIEQQYVLENKIKTYFNKGVYSGNGTEKSPYLISNLGTFESINSLQTTKNLYFKLINNIDFNKNNQNVTSKSDLGFAKNWTGVGKVKSEWQETSNAFVGTFSSGARIDPLEYVENNIRMIRYIKNISGNSGLFNQLEGGAVIENLIIGSSNISSTTNIGAVANLAEGRTSLVTIRDLFIGDVQIHEGNSTGGEFNISTDSASAGVLLGRALGSVTIQNININDYKTNLFDANFTPNSMSLVNNSSSQSFAGGLIGVVDKLEDAESKTTIQNVHMPQTTNVGVLNSDSKKSYYNAGGVIGKLEENAIVELDGITYNTLTVNATQNGGGVVAENNGTLNIHTNCQLQTISVNVKNTENSLAGGIAANNNSTIDFVESSGQTFTLKVNFNNQTEVENGSAYISGGIAAKSNGNITGHNKVNVTLDNLRARKYAGGLVGNMTEGSIGGIKITLSSNPSYAEIVGGIVGYMEGGTIGGSYEANNEEQKKDNNITLEGSIDLGNSYIVGGAVGTFASGNINNITSNGLTISVHENTAKGIPNIVKSAICGIGGLVGIVGEDTELKMQDIEFTGANIIATGITENVGGIIGYLASNNLSGIGENFKVSELVVQGMKNVGGFVGYYKSTANITASKSLSFYLGNKKSEGTTETADDKMPYAEVNIPINSSSMQTSSSDSKDFTNGENFGGIFGQYSIDEGDNSILTYNLDAESVPFANYNQVLVNADNQKLSDGISQNYNPINNTHTISNVGGIVGYTNVKTITGSNHAQIGTSLKGETIDDMYFNKTQTEIRGALTTTLNIQNVGGLIGKHADSTYAVIKDASNEGEINGYRNVGGIVGSSDIKIQIENASSGDGNEEKGYTKVSGYENVGGIIGYLSNSFTSDITSASGVLKIRSEVRGYSNVGLVVGSLTASKDTEIISTLTRIDAEGKVYGLTNIGGYIGHTDQNLTISSKDENEMPLKITIFGNSNVGGIIGNNRAEGERKIAIKNFKVKTNTDEKNIVINAFNYMWKTNSMSYSGEMRDDEIIYIPTSIGGIIGASQNVELSDQITLTTKITTEFDGSELLPVKNQSLETNYVHSTADSCYPSNTSFTNRFDDKATTTGDMKTYEGVTSGIGGIIGTLNNYKTATLGKGKISSTMDIYVPNGLNVGGVVGYFYYNNNNQATLPTYLTSSNWETSNDDLSYIAGGMGVGGIIGRLDSNNMITFDEGVTLSNVVLQQKLEVSNSGKKSTTSVFGEYIGGYIGYSTASIQAIKLNVPYNGDVGGIPVHIDNTLGGYIGGIIGRLDGDLYNKNTKPEGKDSSNEQSSLYMDGNEERELNIFEMPDNYNYGGLVGTVVTKESGTDDVYVWGRHNQPFTVNTIRIANSQFLASSTQAYTDSENVLSLIGHTNFNGNISVTAPEGNGDYKYKLEKADKTGITLPDDYKLFKNLQSYTRPSSSEFVSAFVITDIYSADNIKAVGYNANVKEIVYTIYANNNEDVLYTLGGIAVSVGTTHTKGGSSTTQTEDVAKFISNSYGCRSVSENGKQFIELPYSVEGVNNEEYTPKYELQFDIKEIDSDEALGGDLHGGGFEQYFTSDIFKGFRSASVLRARINGYLPVRNADSENELKPKFWVLTRSRTEGTDTWTDYYVFDTIYATFEDKFLHDTSNEKTVEPSEYNSEQPSSWNHAHSGSVFDVSGFSRNKNSLSVNVTGETKLTGWGKFWHVMTYLLPGFAARITGHKGWVGDIADRFSLSGLADRWVHSHLSRTSTSVFSKTISTAATSNYLYQGYDGQFGLIGDIYSSDWYFSYDKLKSSSDQIVNILSIVLSDADQREMWLPYAYLSDSMPKDFYARIEIDDENLSASNTLAKYADNTNNLTISDTVPKYAYKDGKYYISLLFMDPDLIEYRPIYDEEKYDKLNVKGEDPISRWEGEDYYVANALKVLEDIGKDEGIDVSAYVELYKTVVSQYLQSVSIDEESILSSETIEKDIYFEYYDVATGDNTDLDFDLLPTIWGPNDNSKPSHGLYGIHFIEQKFSDMDWVVVNSTEGRELIQNYVDNHTLRPYIPFMTLERDDEGLLYFSSNNLVTTYMLMPKSAYEKIGGNRAGEKNDTIWSENKFTIGDHLGHISITGTEIKPGDVYSGSAIAKWFSDNSEEIGKNRYTKGVFLINSGLNVAKYQMTQFFGEDGPYAWLTYTSRTTDVTRKVTYQLYNLYGTADYKVVEENGVQSAYRLISDDELQTYYLYTKDGKSAALSTIKSNGALKDYYTVLVNGEVPTGDDAETYKASNYYLYEDGKYYVYDSSISIEKKGGINILSTALFSDPKYSNYSNRHQYVLEYSVEDESGESNRFRLTIYTRYKFNLDKWIPASDWLETKDLNGNIYYKPNASYDEDGNVKDGGLSGVQYLLAKGVLPTKYNAGPSMRNFSGYPNNKINLKFSEVMMFTFNRYSESNLSNGISVKTF